ncbi:MAG: peptide chain release factor 1 [Bacteroidota bacterium]
MLLDKLEDIKERYEEVGRLITDPEIMSNMKRYVQLTKEYKDLEPIIEARQQYKEILDNMESTREMFNKEKDNEFKELAREELDSLIQQKEEIEEKIRLLLVPSDPQDKKNAIVEIRAGTGGDEAAIFAGDLYRMYIKFCESKGWKTEVVEVNEGTSGGFKEVIFNVTGDGVYGVMKYESGVHRVQRVPQTETQGRVHTSAATVAVLPEAGEFDIELKTSDIKKETFCSSGPGGQSVNTTYSAVRLTHVPTGIVVSCQDQKSQIKNLDKAMKVLRARIFDREYKKYLDEIASKRKTMVSTGDRSAKIRTYNFPQSRVTDHRIGLTLYNLSAVMDGDLHEIIEALQVAENAEKLKEGVS